MTNRYILLRKSTGKQAGSAPTRAVARAKNQNSNYSLHIFDTFTQSFVR